MREDLTKLMQNIRPEDLDVSLSAGIVLRCKQRTFWQIIQWLEDFLDGRPGEFVVYRKASAVNLKLVKDRGGE